MAKEEHLAQLKLGVTAWNQWRITNPEIQQPDLTGADLSRANLSRADLSRADLSFAKLIGADLTGADLSYAHVSSADLSGAHLTRAEIGWTTFAYVNLSRVQGLDTVVHKGPSSISIETLYHSHGNIPEIFLRGAGVPEDSIPYIKSLCWLDEHQIPPYGLLYDEIDRGIRLWDKVLWWCSKASLTSWWVNSEINKAFVKEQRRPRKYENDAMRPRAWPRLRLLWGDARCLLRHPGLLKFDGVGANGRRWRCRICGRLWAYRWR